MRVSSCIILGERVVRFFFWLGRWFFEVCRGYRVASKVVARFYRIFRSSFLFKLFYFLSSIYFENEKVVFLVAGFVLEVLGC